MNREERKKRWDIALKKEAKKEFRKKMLYRIATFILIIWVIFSYIIGTELWIPINDCERYYVFSYRYFNSFLVFLFLGFSAYAYYKIVKEGMLTLIVFLLTAIYPLYSLHIDNYLKDKRIEDNPSVVKLGVILDKYQPHFGGVITINYKENSEKKEWSFDTRDFPIKKLSVGDTILFVWVEKCKYIGKVYKFKPTKAELEKCKNDCYFINGELIPVEAYKRK